VFDLQGDPRRSDLAHGGAFVRGVALPELAECELVVTCGGREMSLDARVVMVGSGGVGLELVGFGPALRERLTRFAEAAPITPSPEATPPPVDVEPVDATHDEPEATPPPVDAMYVEPVDVTYDEPVDEPLERTAADFPAQPEHAAEDAVEDPTGEIAVGDVAPDSTGMDDLLELSPFEPEPMTYRRSGDFEAEDVMSIALETDTPAAEPLPEPVEGGPPEQTAPDPTTEESEERALRGIALNVHERVRGLNLQQQIKMALTGEISERLVLERIYGKTVWEHLLRNPRITGPEVARIARMGQLPRPQIEAICNNGGWLQIPEVRRALLSHPRLGNDQILRILRLLPKNELKLATMQTAYPTAVREQARRLLRSE
jgi:hypothetical protein